MPTKTAIIAQLHSLSTRVYKFCKNSLRIPVVCILCDQYLSEAELLCDHCYTLLQTLKHGCKVCAKPLRDLEQTICNDCQRDPPEFDKIYTAFAYVEPLQHILHNFKYYNALYLKSLITKLLQAAPIPHNQIGCLVPVPLSKQKLQQRGYNQAAILGKELAKQLSVQYNANLIKKILHTTNQVDLTGDARRKNLCNAFACIDDIAVSTVTLIDDIVTTGSTVNEISKVLKARGVNSVNVWCVARTTNFQQSLS